MNRAIRSRAFRITLGATVAALTLAACGTTVRDPNVIAAGAGLAATPGSGISSQGPGGGSTGSSATVPGTTSGPSLAPGTGGAGPGSGSLGTTGSAGGAGGSTSTGSGGSATAPTGQPAITSGPGKLSPVEVGMIYIPDADAFTKLVGGKGTVGNQFDEAQAAVNWVNAHGGLNGHPIKPLYFKQPALATTPYSTMMASACSSWTQDNHVVAGMLLQAGGPNDLAQCLNAAGVTYVSGSSYLHDNADYAKYPHFFSPYEANTEDVMSTLISYLLSQGKLTSKSKVGVLLADNEPAAVNAYQNVIVPTLKAHGISVGQYDVEFPASTLDAANALGEVKNDQLHMRADGVTNVIFMAPGGAATFMNSANSQGWHPQYALTTWDSLQQLETNSSAETAQLPGAVAVGWEPSQDVGVYGTHAYANSATAECDQMMNPTGQVTSETSQASAYAWCDGFLALRDAAIAYGVVPTLTSADLTAGFAKIGNRVSAVAIGTSITSTHHAGVSEYRPMTFASSCSCFQYSGPPARLS